MTMREFPPIGAQVVLEGRTYTYCRSMDVEGWWSEDRTEYARPFDTAGQGLHVLWEHEGRPMRSEA